MSAFSSRRMLGLASTASLCITLAANVAVAQAVPPSGTSAAESADTGEIIVTANKREESLNKVGLTVTAISGAMLAERKITSLQDVASIVPGLSFAPSANNTPILTLRGIGFNESSLGVYPAVSVYVDQAPLPFPVLASHAGFDLERIEVLKGPQGTLFGENSTGGAINYIANKPTRTFRAGGDISYGRFNRLEGNAYISGPLSATMRARLAVSAVNSNGHQISYTRPYDRNGKTSYVTGRAQLDWDPTSAIHLAFSLSAWRDRSEPLAGQFILLQPQTPGDEQPQEVAAPFSPENPRAADWDIGINRPRSNRRFIQPALRADITLAENLTLTSLTSYSRYKQAQTTDGDGSALVVTDLQRDDGFIHSFNQEVRLANGSRAPFRWVLGANYEKSMTFERQLLIYPDNNSFSPGKNFIFQNYQQGHQAIRNYAGFGNIEYDVTDKLTVKAATRYTSSRNRAEICGFDAGDGRIAGLFNFLGTIFTTEPFTPISSTGTFANNCFSLGPKGHPTGVPFTQTLKEHNVSWRAGIDYRVTPTTLFYVNVSRGYKAGSFPILAAATTAQFAPVTQESVTAFEAGIKTSFFNRRAQLNAAAFYYDYRDKQVLTKVADPVFGILDQLRNIPKSRVMGAEADLTVRVAPGLTLGGSVTYLDTSIRKYSGVDYVGTPRNFAGQPLPFAPKWSYGLNADYKMAMPNGGSPFIGVSLNGRSATDTVPGGNTIVAVNSIHTRVLPGLVHPFRTNSFATVDVRFGYEGADQRWSISAFGKNILNKYYWTNVVTASDFSARYAGPPATYGVTIGFKLK
ncbi:TonB-dependent receptor domain-containing protein [Sphingomonas sp.]|uniref:TonB-dependent receptor n=1 Tax=Sphingomonas sp. TaxID=28214 RepID=UPI002869F9BB|nr:TonB-dependent receptor [Sphingomonas sp.]